MCPRPEQQIVDACVRAANAMHEVEQHVYEGRHLQEARRILVDMRFERALAIFDEVAKVEWFERRVLLEDGVDVTAGLHLAPLEEGE